MAMSEEQYVEALRNFQQQFAATTAAAEEQRLQHHQQMLAMQTALTIAAA